MTDDDASREVPLVFPAPSSFAFHSSWPISHSWAEEDDYRGAKRLLQPCCDEQHQVRQ